MFGVINMNFLTFEDYEEALKLIDENKYPKMTMRYKIISERYIQY